MTFEASTTFSSSHITHIIVYIEFIINNTKNEDTNIEGENRSSDMTSICIIRHDSEIPKDLHNQMLKDEADHYANTELSNSLCSKFWTCKEHRLCGRIT